MPVGRTPRQKEQLAAWYNSVIIRAVIDAGYIPCLAMTEQQPVEIISDVLTHLAFDGMAVADLVNLPSADDPNPNVMYEIGVRQALGLPVVLMAQTDQRLPFDISNQRVLFIDHATTHDNIKVAKEKLVTFIAAAKAGEFNRPMDAVYFRASECNRRQSQDHGSPSSLSHRIAPPQAGDVSTFAEFASTPFWCFFAKRSNTDIEHVFRVLETSLTFDDFLRSCLFLKGNPTISERELATSASWKELRTEVNRLRKRLGLPEFSDRQA